MPVTDQERIDFLEYWPSISCDASGPTDKYTMDSYAGRWFPTAREAIDDTIQRHPDWRERAQAEWETRRLEFVELLPDVTPQAEHDKQRDHRDSVAQAEKRFFDAAGYPASHKWQTENESDPMISIGEVPLQLTWDLVEILKEHKAQAPHQAREWAIAVTDAEKLHAWVGYAMTVGRSIFEEDANGRKGN